MKAFAELCIINVRTVYRSDFVVLLYTFIFIFFFNYFVVLPVMVNKDFHRSLKTGAFL